MKFPSFPPKKGLNIEQVLEAVIHKIPRAKRGIVKPQLKALIFDSHYDSYKGVIAYVRVMEGKIKVNQTLRLMAYTKRIKTGRNRCFFSKYACQESSS